MLRWQGRGVTHLGNAPPLLSPSGLVLTLLGVNVARIDVAAVDVAHVDMAVIDVARVDVADVDVDVARG